MKRRKFVVFTTICILSLMTSCDISAVILGNSNTAQSGDLLFQDTFSDSTGGWDTWVENSSIIDYNTSGLRFYINEPHYNFWSRPKKEFRDVLVDVLATKVSGPDDNNFGLICRYKNRDNFYSFLISSDGYFGIMKVTDGQHELLSAQKLQYSEIIHQGGATNRLQAECNGSNLIFSVNGQKLAVVQDSDIPSGGIGLIAGTYDIPGVDILFDNFIVYQP